MATKEELEGKSMEELHQMAKDMGIDGHDEMDKEELMSALMKEDTGGEMGEKSEMMSDDDEDEEETGTTY